VRDFGVAGHVTLTVEATVGPEPRSAAAAIGGEFVSPPGSMGSCSSRITRRSVDRLRNDTAARSSKLRSRVSHQLKPPVYNAIRKQDAAFYARLEKAGVLLDYGDDDSGLFMKYLRRGSRYYIDVGASELVADDRIKLQSGVSIVRLTEHAVVLSSGVELPADLVVYATGYGSMNGWAADDLAGGRGPRRQGLGLGSGTTKDPGPWEGEERNLWKPTHQPALMVPRRQPASVAALFTVSRTAAQGPARRHPDSRLRLQEVHHLS
jgi:putative flavoprotein involved in K+ transport